MARKNGNGEGSRPRKRADGRWEARFWVEGKRRSVYRSTRKGAAERLAKAIANSEASDRKPRLRRRAGQATQAPARWCSAQSQAVKRRFSHEWAYRASGSLSRGRSGACGRYMRECAVFCRRRCTIT